MSDFFWPQTQELILSTLRDAASTAANMDAQKQVGLALIVQNVAKLDKAIFKDLAAMELHRAMWKAVTEAKEYDVSNQKQSHALIMEQLKQKGICFLAKHPAPREEWFEANPHLNAESDQSLVIAAYFMLFSPKQATSRQEATAQETAFVGQIETVLEKFQKISQERTEVLNVDEKNDIMMNQLKESLQKLKAVREEETLLLSELEGLSRSLIGAMNN